MKRRMHICIIVNSITTPGLCFLSAIYKFTWRRCMFAPDETRALLGSAVASRQIFWAGQFLPIIVEGELSTLKEKNYRNVNVWSSHDQMHSATLTAGMSAFEKIPILGMPATFHRSVAQFGWQEWLINLASFPLCLASMNNAVASDRK